MYHILTGKQRSLVFPVMCNARVKMDYSSNIPDIEGSPSDTTDDTGFGIWGHTGTFTFESVITPYEINELSLAVLYRTQNLLTKLCQMVRLHRIQRAISIYLQRPDLRTK